MKLCSTFCMSLKARSPCLLISCYVLAQDVLQSQAQRSVQRSDIAQQVLLLVQNRFAKLDTF
ncbi:hypothetical protein ADJ79_02485 [Ottowia sp. oral taxon 894]|nr:hypothetical protein ADJ79_02485 [Ottowia sp. oral taxon 894]